MHSYPHTYTYIVHMNVYCMYIIQYMHTYIDTCMYAYIHVKVNNSFLLLDNKSDKQMEADNREWVDIQTEFFSKIKTYNIQRYFSKYVYF